MYEASDKYKQMSSAPARKHDVDITFFRMNNGAYEKYAAYREQEDSPIISFKIINGQTTGGFAIGGTICATLEITAALSAAFQVNDKVEVQANFLNLDGSGGSEYLYLGVFYIDYIAVTATNKKITALDAMARLAKNYISELTYPATVQSMLGEISAQSGVGLGEINIFNDAAIASSPVKATDDKGNAISFTRREVLGYLAGINGGNAYINNVGQIAFSTPRETNYTIKCDNVISQTFGGAELTIDNVVLNKSGTSGSTADDWDENTVQLYVPLDVGEDIVTPIKQHLSGVHFESITLKKQGTGMFEPGDLMTYTALDGSSHKMLIMGVVYELAGGFFSETLYSLAQSSAQRQYSGVQNISQNIATSGTGGGKSSGEKDIIMEKPLVVNDNYSGKKTIVVEHGETSAATAEAATKALCNEFGVLPTSDGRVIPFPGSNVGFKFYGDPSNIYFIISNGDKESDVNYYLNNGAPNSVIEVYYSKNRTAVAVSWNKENDPHPPQALIAKNNSGAVSGLICSQYGFSFVREISPYPYISWRTVSNLNYAISLIRIPDIYDAALFGEVYGILSTPSISVTDYGAVIHTKEKDFVPIVGGENINTYSEFAVCAIAV